MFVSHAIASWSSLLHPCLPSPVGALDLPSCCRHPSLAGNASSCAAAARPAFPCTAAEQHPSYCLFNSPTGSLCFLHCGRTATSHPALFQSTEGVSAVPHPAAACPLASFPILFLSAKLAVSIISHPPARTGAKTALNATPPLGRPALPILWASGLAPWPVQQAVYDALQCALDVS